MTALGKATAEATEGLPWEEEAKPLWNAASGIFARGASGVVHAFVNIAANPESIWATTELPALVDNENVTEVIFHLIGG